MIMLNTNTLRQRLLAGTALVAIGSFTTAPALALDPNTLPTGGRITSGSGLISQNGTRMDVNQTSQRMIANWNSFSIGSNAWVNFNQPNSSAVALNRVVGNDPSQIFGRLTANGQVFLINPNGVLFGQSGRADVGGIVASTLNITDQNFMAGRYTFTNDGGAGSVVNQGTISVIDRGYAALFGTSVSNQGVIVARQGSVALGAGDAVSMDFGGDGLINLAVDKGTLNALVENKGAIKADGGTVVMRAKNAGDLAATVVNHSGVIEAQAISDVGGKIVLDGGDAGIVAVSGTLDVSGKGAGQHGGSVTVQGDKIGLFAGAKVDASGASGGGTVKVGGGRQGKDSTVRNASATYLDSAASIDVSALINGDGGTAILWSDDYTGFYGSISARGGAQGGNGGFVETSSHNNIQAFGAVAADAAHGSGGSWLVDPRDITIVDGGIGVLSNVNNTQTAQYAFSITPTGNSAQISNAAIASYMSGTCLTCTMSITTNGAGSQNGDITVAGNIAITSGGAANLFLGAYRNIIINPGVSITGGFGNPLSVWLSAGANGGSGSILMNAGSAIMTFGGQVRFGGGYATFADWTDAGPVSTKTAVGIALSNGDTAYLRNGITINSATINTFENPINVTGSAGAVIMAGKGYSVANGTITSSNALTGTAGVGVLITGSSTIFAGSVNILGVGGKGTDKGGGTGVDIGKTSATAALTNFNAYPQVFTAASGSPVLIGALGAIAVNGTGGLGIARTGSAADGSDGGTGIALSDVHLATMSTTDTIALVGTGANGAVGCYSGCNTNSSPTNNGSWYYGYGGYGGNGISLLNTLIDAASVTASPSISISGSAANGANGPNSSLGSSYSQPGGGASGYGVISYNLTTTLGNVVIHAYEGYPGAGVGPFGPALATQRNAFLTAGLLDVGSHRLIVDMSTLNGSYGRTAKQYLYDDPNATASKITAAELQLLGKNSSGSVFDFSAGSNKIDVVSGGLSTAKIDVYLNNGANPLVIGSIAAINSYPETIGIYTGTTTITTSGAVTQANESSVVANFLNLYGNGGTYTLDQANNVQNLIVGQSPGDPSPDVKVARAYVNNDINSFSSIELHVSGSTYINSTGGDNTNNDNVLDTGSLQLTGDIGAWSLTGSLNKVGTLAANTGAVLLLNSQDLIVGTVSGFNNGNNNPIRGSVTGVTTSRNWLNAIVLSTSGKFTNTAGSDGLKVSSEGDNSPRWLVYSDNKATIVKGSLSGSDFSTIPTSYATLAPDNVLMPSGNQFLYLREAGGSSSGSSSSSSGGGSGSSSSSSSGGSSSSSSGSSSSSSSSSGGGSSSSSSGSSSSSSSSSSSGGSSSSGSGSSSGSTSTPLPTSTTDNAAATAVRAATNPPPSSNGTSTTSSTSTAPSAPPPVSTQTTTVNQPVPLPGGGATLSGGLIHLSADLVSFTPSPVAAPSSSPSANQPSTQASPSTTALPSTSSGGTISTPAAGGSASSSTPSFGAVSASLPNARILSVSSGNSAGTVVVRQSGDTLILSATSDAGAAGNATSSFQQPSTTTGGGTGLGVFTVSGDQTAQVGSFQVGYSAGNLTMAPGANPVQTMAAPADAGSVVTFRVATQNGGEAEFGLSFTNGALSIRPLNDNANAITSSGNADQKLVSATGLLQAQERMGVDVGQVRAIFVHGS